MSIISWNIRGLSYPEKMFEVKTLISKLNTNCIGLIETKLTHVLLANIVNIWGFNYFDYAASPAFDNHNGGLLKIGALISLM